MVRARATEDGRRDSGSSASSRRLRPLYSTREARTKFLIAAFIVIGTAATSGERHQGHRVYYLRPASCGQDQL